MTKIYDDLDFLYRWAGLYCAVATRVGSHTMASSDVDEFCWFGFGWPAARFVCCHFALTVPLSGPMIQKLAVCLTYLLLYNAKSVYVMLC